MNLTPLYVDWLAQLAVQERMALLLTGAALLVVVAVVTADDRHRRWMLPWAALGFGGLGFVVLVYGLLQPNVSVRMPTFGVLIGQPLWYDETFTWAVARLDWGQMLAAIGGDVHPPLWYVVEWVTIRLLGGSEVALRLPALLFGLGGLWLTYRMALALGYSERVARWSVVLLAVLPGWRYYAQEARMYTLLSCGVLAAVLGLVSRRNWLMALGMVATLYTHNLGAFYVVTVGTLAAWRGWRGDRERPGRGKIGKVCVTTGAWLCLVGLAWAPWVAVLIRQIGDVANGFWVPDLGPGGYLLQVFQALTLIGIPDSLQIHAVLATTGLLALAVWNVVTNRAGELVHAVTTLGVVAFAPPVLLALASEFWRPVFLHRALLPSLPFLAILATAALDRMAGRYRRVILTALVPVLVLGTVWQSKEGLGGAKLAEDVAEYHRAGDTIYHANLASYILLSYYMPEEEGYRHAVWPDAGNLAQALSLPTQEAMGVPRMEAEQAMDRSARLLVVWVENPMTTQAEVEELEETLALGDAVRLVDWSEKEAPLVNVGLWAVDARQGQDPGAK